MRKLSPLYWISQDVISDDFPEVDQALEEPNGLLAVGGDLSSERLLSAYRRGIFPWYSGGQPILWWSPDPRCVLFPEDLKISRSLRATMKRGHLEVSMDGAFRKVMEACAGPRRGQAGSWITPEMIEAYGRLHALGYAHSVECRRDGKLVGGLYGVALGRVFFGESMFAIETDASKVSLVHLMKHLRYRDFKLIDCQTPSRHLESLGAVTIPRKRFIEMLEEWCAPDGSPGCWGNAAREQGVKTTTLEESLRSRKS